MASAQAKFVWRGALALVTGASSGIGEMFARALAQRGMALLLTALPDDLPRLQALATELAREHAIRVEFTGIDLAASDAPRRLQAFADAHALEPDLLVNNAGVGTPGSFVDVPLERQVATIRLNVEALVSLTALYLPRMVARGGGAVINVGSTAAFQPLPHFAVYAASKAFVVSFSEALWAEYHRHGVRVVVVCPGPVAETGFNPKSVGTSTSTGIWRFLENRYMTREAVVASALEALERDQPRVVRRVPVLGMGYYPIALIGSLIPRRFHLLGLEWLTRWSARGGAAADNR